MFNKSKKMKKTGTKNLVAIENSLNSIETLTKQYRLKRISTEKYMIEMQKSLSNLTSERDYIQYLLKIGQK